MGREEGDKIPNVFWGVNRGRERPEPGVLPLSVPVHVIHKETLAFSVEPLLPPARQRTKHLGVVFSPSLRNSDTVFWQPFCLRSTGCFKIKYMAQKDMKRVRIQTLSWGLPIASFAFGGQ